MRRFLVPTLMAIALAMPMILANLGGPTPVATAQRSNAVPGKYIVTLKPQEQPAAVSSRMSAQTALKVEHVYQYALKGFSAIIPDNQLEKVRNDPAVLSVVEDRKVSIQNDTRPTGIRRSEADRNALSQIGTHTNPIDVDVAVIDTGIDGDHPDLNVVGGVNCVPGESSWEDLHGHGTHVAGTIGALDNESGVVGVAPGARLWAVRVLDANGDGEFSDVICGVDWVTAKAATVEIANMSLGGEGTASGCTGGGFHQAVCESIEAGVTYVVAAGNSSVNASSFVPASFPEVITVSAIADTDGQPGGNGPSSIFYGADDSFATFSNYGSAVDIAAPGVNILSTWLNSSYNTSSGTSMASPHVAGAAAIYAFQNPGASPAATEVHIMSQAWAQSSPEGFTGDSDGFPEPLLNVGTIGGFEPLPPPPPPEAGCSLTADSGIVGSQTTLSCAGLEAFEWVWIHWDSVGQGYIGLFIASGTGEGTANVTIPDATFGEHLIIARGSTSGIQTSLPFTVEPSVELASTSGTVGSLMYLNAKGFEADESVDVRWYYDADTFIVLKTDTTSSTGRINVFVKVPDAARGIYTVEAVGSVSGASGSGEFEILPTLKVRPGAGKIGATTTINVSGFYADEPVNIRWAGNTIASGTADSLGKASFQVVVPESPAGSNVIEAVGDAGSQASDTYAILSSMTLSTTWGEVGSEVDVLLTGFIAGETIRLDWYNSITSSTTLLTVGANELGSASTLFSVPEDVSGYHRLEATGLISGSRSGVNFSILSKIVLSKSSGLRGDTVTATMTGYKANETVNVNWYELPYIGEIVGSATTSSLGTATVTFQIPEDASFGDHKVESVSAANKGWSSTTFTVENEGGPLEATCTIDPETGTGGTQATVDCYGFEPGEYIRIYWDTTTSFRLTTISAPNGSGSSTINIPYAAGGEHTVIGVGQTSGLQATTNFTVLATFKLSTTSGPAGSYIQGTARGYVAGETVKFVWHDGSTSFIVKTATASSSGQASAFFPTPEVAGGTYTVEAFGQTSGTSLSAEYTVTAGIKASPSGGKVGTTLNITVGGFVAGSSVDIFWDNELIGSIVTSQTGAGSLSMTVPEASHGSHTIRAESINGEPISTDFQILPDISLSDSSGPVGSETTVSITGFGAGETVRIEWVDAASISTIIATSQVSADGSATFDLTIPESSYGFHWVQATGLQSQATVNTRFTVSASMLLSHSEGPSGTTVTVELTGFKANQVISWNWYTTSFTSYELTSAVADENGSATLTFDVPDDATPSDYKVEARNPSGIPRIHTMFTVT